MTKEEKAAFYSLDAMVSIGKRGQIVIPKEIREKAHIKIGEKIAIITFGKEEKICLILLMKIEKLKTIKKRRNRLYSNGEQSY